MEGNVRRDGGKEGQRKGGRGDSFELLLTSMFLVNCS